MIADIDKILETNIAHPVVKKAARKLKRDHYFHPSEFFTKLTRHDSEVLSEMAAIITDKDDPLNESKSYQYQNMILLSAILSMAEGVYLDEEDEIVEATRIVSVMCIANNLHRKGLVKCHYDNMTFDPAGLNDIIMERLDK